MAPGFLHKALNTGSRSQRVAYAILPAIPQT